ncbi:peptide chain release factor-like protein [Penicillium herquei]|nr:peptide chain release factor-like protein [Penicillium herquei]
MRAMRPPSTLTWSRAINALSKPWGLPVIPFISCQTFTTTPALPAKPLPPRMKFEEADLTISYLKGTGPGGQKINKTNSAVQITHKPSGVVVKCQATRSQSQNAKMARALLADKVEELEKGDQSRNALKLAAARKKKASKLKKTRRKYRSLEKDALDQENAEGDEDGGQISATGAGGKDDGAISAEGNTDHKGPSS